MYLSIHVTVGALVGRYIPNPILSFFVGFFGHFLTDMIPHGDSAVYRKYKNGINTKRSTAIALIDGTFAIMIAVLMLALGDFSSTLGAATAIIGSVLPDVIIGLHILYEPPWLHKFHEFHFFMHDFIVSRFKDWRQIHGAIFQSVVWVLIMIGARWQ